MQISIPYLKRNYQLKDKSLSEVLDELKKNLIGKGLAIIDFKLDGKSLTLDMQKKLADENINNFQRLEVKCRKATELALSVLDEVIKHLPNLSELSNKAGDLLSKGDKSTGLVDVKNYFELWQVILDSVNKIGILLNIDFKQIKVGKVGLEGEILAIVDLIGQCKNALADGDFVVLNDVIDYELSEKIDTIGKILDELKRCIEESQ